ncbi:MAG TPA: hypothetical protein PLU30_23365 [Verrucomicrobiae bacterium]|nr:hypothetical protein [Verrucomicrobiae bacterium]
MKAENSVEAISASLLMAEDRAGQPLLTPGEATARAALIWEEVNELGLALEIFTWTGRGFCGEPLRYPAYRIDDQRYDLNSVGPGQCAPFAANGPGISCGDLLRLGRVCQIKQQLLPRRWPKDLRDRLCDPQSHLDGIEEIWWLGRWYAVTDVKGKVPTGVGGKDIDWEIRACTFPLRLEVENWRREWSGMVHGFHRGREFPSCFERFRGRFARADAGDALNVACVTTLLEPDEKLEQRSSDFLATNPEVDAIVVWSRHSLSGRMPPAVYGKTPVRGQLRALLMPPQREDLEHVVPVEFLPINPDTGKTLLPDEYGRLF